ncbi:MAG: sterol desaturase family protein [Acidobacteria bacterium]|nr:sterol desaturase family protein [Acidobacteriota bacterium]
MDDVKYIAYAIPVFFVLIAIEWLWTRDKGNYRLADAINNLSCGVMQQLTTLFMRTALFAGYVWIFTSFRQFELSMNRPLVWVVCFLAVDFMYYWFHRLSHEINALWAAHVVHHQSEDYNLAVALRQSSFQGIFSSFFYWPLAWIGFPPGMFLALSAANTLYQFWIHTQAIDRMGPFEWLFNTPSHHRVHHGRNPIYIDRNHGGTLIIWDRLFGTFQKETEPVVYGITTPLASWNPLWANFHYWVELWQSARTTSRWRDKVRVFTKAPGWFPQDMGGFKPPPPVSHVPAKYGPELTPEFKIYIWAQFAWLVMATFVFLFQFQRYEWAVQASFTLWVLVGLWAIGGLSENKRAFRWVELVRLLLWLPLVWPYFSFAWVWGPFAVLLLSWMTLLRPKAFATA